MQRVNLSINGDTFFNTSSTSSSSGLFEKDDCLVFKDQKSARTVVATNFVVKVGDKFNSEKMRGYIFELTLVDSGNSRTCFIRDFLHDVKIHHENTATEIATHGFDHGDRHYNLRVAAKPRTHVSVFVPIAMPDNELTTLLARYGKIACLRRLHYKEQDLQQYKNGVCVVEFESLDTAIPSRIHYAGINISFVYTGQPKTCVRCGALDHLVKECPVTKRPRNKLDNTDQQDRPQQQFNTSSPAAQQQPSTPTSDMDDTDESDDESEIADDPPLDPSTITTVLPTKRNLTNDLQALDPNET
ncbi:hypothetical protein QZH41_000985 [Actinostola sp. cb2023]|nr:hypothetical protein QZH41_000985 [Actinostola sp. cb2023]